MADLKRISVQYADKFRLWQELVLATERQGTLFLATDADAQVGDVVDVDVSVGGEPSLARVKARVEAFRPASLRFARGVTIRIDAGELEHLRSLIGLLPADPGGSAGRCERRYRVKWPLWFRTPAILRRCLTIDLSEGGMQAEMPERVRRGHVVEFTLLTPQGHELMMAGEVQWASETERRIGVQFLFPDATTARGFSAMLKHAVRSMGGRAHTGTLLVLDEEQDSRDYMIAALAARGYRVLWSSTTEEALALAREERPDLVLIDPRGIRLSAPVLCRTLKADRELCDVPILFVASSVAGRVASSDAGDEWRQLAKDVGVSDWIPKPIQLRTLVAKVARHLDESAAA